MSMVAGSPLNLVVSGDIVVDHHYYEGQRDTPMAVDVPGLIAHPEPGGAIILRDLLDALSRLPSEPATQVNVKLGIKWPPADGTPPSNHHAYGFWSPHLKDKAEKKKKSQEQKKVWRARLPMGYGDSQRVAEKDKDTTAANAKPLYVVETPKPAPDVLVLDDAGFEFRKPIHEPCWFLPKDADKPPRWVVLKMSQPIAQGMLWDKAMSLFPERLVCVVTADELRQGSVNISRGLSWERSVEDLHYGLLNNWAFAPLTTCGHLIVGFSADGALWLDQTRPGGPHATLIFDADGAEGVWNDERDGSVFGLSTVLTAAIACQVARAQASAAAVEPAKLDLLSAIKSGLAAARDLQQHGHGEFSKDHPKGFPTQRLAMVMAKPDKAFASARISWPATARPATEPTRQWMLVEELQRPPEFARYPLIGLARQIAVHGMPAVAKYPHACFGKLVTIDRAEIEALRSLRRLMVAYDKLEKAEKPLSIGVFGPPGSGKSFGVKQIAKEVFGGDALLEFNLSQFNGAADLIGAFHQVRDKVLSGTTPVVLWDEFDSQSHKWLQYLLAPMQDGRFQEEQISHWIGKCVFVFAGGTSYTYGEFTPPEDADEDKVQRPFRLSKGPDFHSRLDGYYDVVGPNQRTKPPESAEDEGPRKRDAADICFPLRRALLIRSILKCKDDEEIDVDPDLLDALLLVPEYVHGTRSLEKLVADLRQKKGGTLRRSSLPALLAMHVDAGDFAKLLKRNEGFLNAKMIDTIAGVIHGNYLKLSDTQGYAVQPDFAKEFEKLSPAEKSPNVAAARRYPRILSLVGAGIVKTDSDSSEKGPNAEAIAALLELHIEMLAEEEHKGWMEERKAVGWQYGKPRNNDLKIHPLLVPYVDLDEKEKMKDRDSVRKIPSVVADAGYRIVWLGQ